MTGTAVAPVQAGSSPFVVRLELDDENFTKELKAGSYGDAAIYMSAMAVAYVIRRVMIWMQAWLSLIVPA